MKFIKLVSIFGEGERRTIWIDPNKIRAVALHPSGLQIYLGSKFSFVVDCTILELNRLLRRSEYVCPLPLEEPD